MNFSATTAKASLISQRSMSSTVRPALASTLRAAGTGALSISVGSSPTLAVATIRARGPALAALVATQQRAWAHLASNPDDGVEAMIRQRPDAKLDRDVLRAQIRLTIEFFDTPATKGRPIGWQAEQLVQVAKGV